MKKTLIALFALAGMVHAAEPIATLDGTTTHVDLTNTTAAYITAVMNMETFETLVTNQTSEVLVTFNLTAGPGTKQVGTGTQDGTLKGTHNTIGTSPVDAYYTPTGGGIGSLTSTLDFNSLEGAALTFAYDKAEGSRIILTTLDKTGSYTDYIGVLDSLKWSSSQINGANIVASYITLANVYSGTWKDNMDSVVATAHSMVTPEPATATLSLLALAGLAARRRRH